MARYSSKGWPTGRPQYSLPLSVSRCSISTPCSSIRATGLPVSAHLQLNTDNPQTFIIATNRGVSAFLKLLKSLIQTTDAKIADSGRRRSAFRGDSDHDSWLIPISIPARKRSLFLGQADQ